MLYNKDIKSIDRFFENRKTSPCTDVLPGDGLPPSPGPLLKKLTEVTHMPEKDCRLELRISQKDKNFLEDIAKKKGTTKSEILRKLLHSKKVNIINDFDTETMTRLWNNIAKDGNMQMKALIDLEYIEKAIKNNERFLGNRDIINALYQLRKSVETLQKDLIVTRQFLLDIKKRVD